MVGLEIIAELSGCHGGDFHNANQLIELAKSVGATGVKFQCFDPVRLAARRARHPRIKAINWPGKPETFDEEVVRPSLESLYKDTQTPQKWFPDLIRRAEDLGLTWHASVFDPEDVEFLESLNCPRYKIASFEAHDTDVTTAVTKTQKPFILSVNQSEDVVVYHGANVTVLHATDYGVPALQANLRRMRYWHDGVVMSRGQHWKWGLSDHTVSDHAAEIAVALGACMVEWHLRLPHISTPDDKFSWTAQPFRFKARRLLEIHRVLND